MKGYKNTKTQEVVYEEDAFEHALEVSLNGTEEDKQEFIKMLVEWFYSGNWVEIETKEEEGYIGTDSEDEAYLKWKGDL